MSLSAREQQALAGIEEFLSGSDPGLASRLAIFARLTAGEDMPAREEIRPPEGHPRQWRGWARAAPGWSLVCVLLWVAVSVSMIATALMLK